MRVFDRRGDLRGNLRGIIKWEWPLWENYLPPSFALDSRHTLCVAGKGIGQDFSATSHFSMVSLHDTPRPYRLSRLAQQFRMGRVYRWRERHLFVSAKFSRLENMLRLDDGVSGQYFFKFGSSWAVAPLRLHHNPAQTGYFGDFTCFSSIFRRTTPP